MLRPARASANMTRAEGGGQPARAARIAERRRTRCPLHAAPHRLHYPPSRRRRRRGAGSATRQNTTEERPDHADAPHPTPARLRPPRPRGPRGGLSRLRRPRHRPRPAEPGAGPRRRMVHCPRGARGRGDPHRGRAGRAPDRSAAPRCAHGRPARGRGLGRGRGPVADPDPLLRGAGGRERGHDHREPQPARVQRAQDHPRRGDPVRGAHPEAPRTARGARLAERPPAAGGWRPRRRRKRGRRERGHGEHGRRPERWRTRLPRRRLPHHARPS